MSNEESIDTFNPVKYSLEECAFLRGALGKPTVVALRDIPPLVIVKAVKPILDRVNELQDLVKHEEGFTWLGLEPMREIIDIYLAQQKKWAADKKRFPRAPRFPSMHSYDAKNKPHRGGPGSDAGEVRTYFDKEGNRHAFALNLLSNQETGGWAPEWASETTIDTKAIRNDVENRRLECTVCKHTETYKVDSASSYNAARGRLSKHLRTATDETSLHRELYTNEFGS